LGKNLVANIKVANPQTRRKEIAMRMNRLAMGGVVATWLLAGATFTFAASDAKPLGKMTCEDFLAVDDSVKPKVVYWAVAYAKGGKPEAAVLDVEGTEKITPLLIEECKAAPKESFWKKVKAEVKKLAKKM
jgi:acid stress chaperone HdeA